MLGNVRLIIQNFINCINVAEICKKGTAVKLTPDGLEELISGFMNSFHAWAFVNANQRSIQDGFV